MRLIRRPASYASCLLVLLVPLHALAATRTWDGEGTNLKWNNPVNWSSNTVPGWNDIAVFDATNTKNVDIGSGAIVNSLQIRNGYTGTLRTVSGASIYVGTGGWLQQAGTFQSGTGSFTVRSSLTLTGGTLIASPHVLTVTGNFNHTGGTFTANGGTLSLVSPSARMLTTSATLSTVNAESTLETGLAAYWKLDEDPLATGLPGISSTFQRSTAYDFSGNGWDLQMPSKTYTAATNWPVHDPDGAPFDFTNAGAMRFKRTNSWLRLDESRGFELPASATVAFWLKNPDTATLQIPIASVPLSAAWALYIQNGNFDMTGTACAVPTISASFLSDGGWHQVSFVKDGATCYLYVDGAVARSVSANATATMGSGVMLGNYPNFDVLGINGSLDDVRLYDRALSSAEVSELAAGRYATRTGGSTLTLGSNINVSSMLTNANGTLAVAGYTLSAAGATLRNFGALTRTTGSIVNASTLSASPSSLAAGGSISYSVTDANRNADGTAIETLSTTADGESVTLTETSKYSGIFTGSIETAHAAQTPGNGRIEYDDRCGYFVTANYSDPADGTDTQTSRVEVSDPASPCEIPGSGGGSRGGGSGRGASASGAPSQATTQGSSSSQASSVSSSVSSASSSSTTMFPAAPDSAPLTVGSLTLRDVPIDSWFAPFVRQLVEAGAVTGYNDKAGNPLGLFKPANHVTYAETVKMALVLRDVAPSSDEPRNMSARGTWASGYIRAAEDLGITTLPASLNVHDAATRGAVVQTLLEIARVPFDGTENPYTDLPSTHPYAKAILTATKLGLIKGDDGKGTVRPDDTINRAEVAALLARFSDMPNGPAAMAAPERAHDAAPEYSGYRTTASVSVRAEPRIDAVVLTKLSADSFVRVVRTIAETWAEVIFDGDQHGYMGLKYLEPLP
jgi:hypothetical protein